MRYFICEIFGKPFYPKKLCMEMPCWCSFEGHKYGRRKPTETSVSEFSYKCVNSLLEQLIEIKVILILRQRIFVQILKSQKIDNIKYFEPSLELSQSPATCKCRVTRKPGNSSVHYRKTKNPFEPKICVNKSVKVP